MFEEDYSTWSTEALVSVPPETLEYVDLVALVHELQDRLLSMKEAYDAAVCLAADH